MTRFILAMALCAFALAPCAAQSFTSSPASPISDSLHPTTDVITVSGGPISISTMKVVLDITHTWDSDLDIFLLPPPGLGLMPIELTTDNGSSGDDYTNTEFTGTGDGCLVASGPITGGTAPFTGLFNP